MQERAYIVLDPTHREADGTVFGFEPGGDDVTGAPVLSVQPMTPAAARELNSTSAKVVAPPLPLQLVEPVTRAEAAADSQRGAAWGIEAVGATECPYTGMGVKVAVLDTGIDARHPAFKDLEVTQEDFTGEGDGDHHGHGTHCAATIAGRDVDGRRIGVAPGIDELLVAKVLGARGGGSTAALSDGMQWALRAGANVLSMSLGIDFPGMVREWTAQGLPTEPATSQALEDYRQNLQLFAALADLLAASAIAGRAAIVVAATGNESRRAAQQPYTIAVSPPAAAEGFIAVAALGRDDDGGVRVADFSNTGAAIAAPGVDIVSAKAGGGLVSMSGTSMATPHAAGVAALWGEHLNRTMGRLDAAMLASRLRGTSRQVDGLSADDGGLGLIQAPQPEGGRHGH